MADAALEALLEVQGHDLAADRLRHRRATLPERTAIAERRATIARADAEVAPTRDRALTLQRSARRLEDEVASTEAKAADADRKLYSGSVTAVRELQALQEDVGSLRRRARALEDELLEVMEEAEPVTSEVERSEAERQRVEAEIAELEQRLAEADAALAAELVEVESARATSASGVTPELLATYEGLRAKLGGVGVARLEGAQCGGCHLALPATELDAVRHARPGTIVRHEECGRILVRV